MRGIFSKPAVFINKSEKRQNKVYYILPFLLFNLCEGYRDGFITDKWGCDRWDKVPETKPSEQKYYFLSDLFPKIVWF